LTQIFRTKLRVILSSLDVDIVASLHELKKNEFLGFLENQVSYQCLKIYQLLHHPLQSRKSQLIRSAQADPLQA